MADGKRLILPSALLLLLATSCIDQVSSGFALISNLLVSMRLLSLAGGLRLVIEDELPDLDGFCE